jgi:phytoene dehydrogenase-like protein
MAHVLLVGAGHNGLVCAFYLARAGHKVTIFEQAPYVGGACRNERWGSGAIVSPGANHFGMLNETIASDMGLWDSGLSIVRASPQLIVGLAEGESLALFDDMEATRKEISYYDTRDAGTLNSFSEDVAKVRRILQRHIFDLNPSLDTFVSDLNADESGLANRFVFNSMKETIEYYFQSEQAKALFSATGFLYNAAPDEPGTAYALAYLSLFQTHGIPGWGVPIGGMGRVVELMGVRLGEFGVQIQTGVKVDRIILNGASAVGVVCACGQEYYGDYIVSNGDPFTTYVKLCKQPPTMLPSWDESQFAGPCAKFNFTYHGTVRPNYISSHHLQFLTKSAYVYFPTLEYAKSAFDSALADGYSVESYFEFLSPSGFDPGLCPAGLSIGSIYSLFANYDVISKWDESMRRERKKEVFSSLVAKLNLRDIVEIEQLDPVDIETKFGMHKGNVDHGSPTLNNMFESRNLERRFGIKGLVVCGAGSHPGGLVSGVPGFNAAKKVLYELS